MRRLLALLVLLTLAASVPAADPALAAKPGTSKKQRACERKAKKIKSKAGARRR